MDIHYTDFVHNPHIYIRLWHERYIGWNAVRAVRQLDIHTLYIQFCTYITYILEQCYILYIHTLGGGGGGLGS